MVRVTNQAEIEELRDRGALFVLNHSGGKDSQTMTILVRNLVPDRQILVIHAVLEGVVWEGDIEQIEATTEELPLILAHPVKTFFQMVERRQRWPSPQQRQCTSDLKRGPIEREIRRYLKQHHEYHGLVVNCMGMRAEESPGRAKLETLKLNKRNSKAGREWYDWLPIHKMTTAGVFETIRAAGQTPHWVYAAGMTRLSCCFCIMASQSDLRCAAGLKRDLYRRYVETEKRIGYTVNMAGKGLEEVTGIRLDIERR